MSNSVHSGEWKRTRRAVAATRPAVCEKCGQVINPGDLWELDHRIPRSRGGTNDLSNLRPLHRRCNRQGTSRLAWESTLRRRQEAARASAAWWDEPQGGGTPCLFGDRVEVVERSRIF